MSELYAFCSITAKLLLLLYKAEWQYLITCKVSRYWLLALYGGIGLPSQWRGRDVIQWLERGDLSMSLPAVRFRIPLDAGFSEKYHVFPLSMLGHFPDVVSLSRHYTSKYFTWLRWKWVAGRTELAMCMISSMRQNSCRTVCSPWSWDGTSMSKVH